MRTFEHPNMAGGFTCPVCGAGDDKPVVLIGIAGTEEDRIMEAAQVHFDCLDNLRFYKEAGIIGTATLKGKKR